MLIIVNFFILFKINLAPIFPPYSLPLSVGPTLGDNKENRFELARIIGISIYYCEIERRRLVCKAREVEVVGGLVALSVLLLSTRLVLGTELWS